MKTRIALLFGLVLVAAGTVFCSGAASLPPLDTCCVVLVTGGGGAVDCFCGSSSTVGDAFKVVVSGSTCTVTNTNDGGDDAQATGSPPQAQTDCMNPQGG
jgi:hypothetical protein